MKVALIRNVQESRSLSMPLYADCLRDVLMEHCGVLDVYLEPDFAYQLAGVTGFRIQDYVGRFWSFPQQLRHLQSDVFHIVDHANAHLIRVLDPARTVVTCHDLILLKLAAGEIPWHGPRPWVAGKTFRWSVDHLPRARAVLCDSESTKRDVIGLVGCAPERLHVLYPGLHEVFRQILDREVRAEARMRFGFTWPITILHVGSPIFYKNVEGIIEALALLSSEWQSRVHIVKAGQDFTPTQWDLIRRRSLRERVHFLGQLSLQDLVLLYNVSDILLFPSFYEGFGWPPLEAMACGTPVVCSDRGSLKEVVGDAAVIVDPEDPKAIAEGMECILTNTGLRETLIARGIERAKQFSWATTAEGVLKVYHEIVGAHTE
jgi:glycosyltransferase involved in cell wall biosynthesis